MKEKLTPVMSLDEVRRLPSQTNWAELEENGDYDGDAEIDVDWSRVEIVHPKKKTMISMRLDPDILDFFRSQGPGYQSKINAVLRSYIKAK